MIYQIASVAVGSALGGVCRFGFSKILNPLLAAFPLGTFAVNIIGCFLLGFFSSFFVKSGTTSENLKLLFTVGFCGSFTTFSTFIKESSELVVQGKQYPVLYAAASLLLGFLALFLGNLVAKVFSKN